MHQYRFVTIEDIIELNKVINTCGRAGNRTPASEVGGESVITLPPWPLSQHI